MEGNLLYFLKTDDYFVFDLFQMVFVRVIKQMYNLLQSNSMNLMFHDT